MDLAAVEASLVGARTRAREVAATFAEWNRRWGSRKDADTVSLFADMPQGGHAAVVAARARVQYLERLASVLRCEATSWTPSEGDTRWAHERPPEELQLELVEWIEDIVVHGYPSWSEERRQALAWSAQLFLPTTPMGQAERLFQETAIDAARSVYALAASSRLQRASTNVPGWGEDWRLFLSFSAYPLLEGLARRRLPQFLAVDGAALGDFCVTPFGASTEELYGPISSRRRRKTCSNLGHVLMLLADERQRAGTRVGQLLMRLRRAPMDLDVCPEVMRHSHASTGDLFAVLFDHRNHHLHGAGSLSFMGLVALLLATVICLEEVTIGHPAYREWAVITLRRFGSLSTRDSDRRAQAFYPAAPE